MKLNKQNLTNLEKTRMKFANREFLVGCEKFIQKCLQEDKRPNLKPFQKQIEKIQQNNKIEGATIHSYKKLYFLLGGLGIGLMIFPYFIKENVSKLSSISDDFHAKYESYIRGIEGGTDRVIVETQNIFIGHGKKFGKIITDNAKGFASFGNSNFYSEDFRQSGIFIPLFEKVAQVGLFWTMTLGGLGFLAELFGINEPSLVQIKYGVFADLSRDQNVYFHRADGRRGIEGAQHHVRGLDVLKGLQRGIDFAALRGDNGTDGRYDINIAHFERYLISINQIQDLIDQGVKSGTYDLAALQAYVENIQSQMENIDGLAVYARAKKGSFVSGFVEFVDDVHTRGNRGKSSMNELIQGQFYKTLPSGREMSFFSNKKWKFLNNAIYYIDDYLHTFPSGVNPAIDSLKLQWQGLIEHNIVNNRLNEYYGKIRWRMSGPFGIMALLPLIAQHEVYAAQQSISYMTSFYDNYYKESYSSQLMTSINQYLQEIDQIRDEAGKLYSLGVITLDKYLKEIDNRLQLYKDLTYYKRGVYQNGGLFQMLKNNFLVKSQDIYMFEPFRKSLMMARGFVEIISEIGALAKYGGGLDGQSGIYDETIKPNTIILGNTIERKELEDKEIEQKDEEYKISIGDYVSTDILGVISTERLNSDERVLLLFNTNKTIDMRIQEGREERYRLLSLLLKTYENNKK